MPDMDSQLQKSCKRIPISAIQMILMFDLQFCPPVTSEQYNARYGFPDTKILQKDAHKCYLVDLHV